MTKQIKINSYRIGVRMGDAGTQVKWSAYILDEQDAVVGCFSLPAVAPNKITFTPPVTHPPG